MRVTALALSKAVSAYTLSGTARFCTTSDHPPRVGSVHST
jgi:hypothetical protein